MEAVIFCKVVNILKNMKIVVVGAGNVGYTVAQTLSAEGKSVIVVERDADRAEKVEEEQDVSVIRGNGARPAVLEQTGILKDHNDVDALIACTDRDETNLMACWLAKRAGVKRVLSRVKDLEFTDTPEWAAELGIDVMASPERSLSREITSLLTVNAAVHTSELHEGRAGSFTFRVAKSSLICGLSLRELGEKYPDFGAVIVYVERNQEGFVPSGDWRAKEGDLCFVVTLYERIADIQKLFDSTKAKKRLSRVIIVGGGKLGTNLANRLTTAARVETTLVEKDAEKCERLAREFQSVKVIHGDGMDKELMLQLGVDKADGVVAATANDELNVIIAALGHIYDGVKTIAVVRNEIYTDLEETLPVDVLLNPNQTLASTFLRHIRYPSSAGLLSMIDRTPAEMFEFILTPDNPHVNKRIMDLHLKKGILIAIIRRNGRYLIPGGQEILRSGDSISLFAMSDLMPTAMRFFEVD